MKNESNPTNGMPTPVTEQASTFNPDMQTLPVTEVTKAASADMASISEHVGSAIVQIPENVPETPAGSTNLVEKYNDVLRLVGTKIQSRGGSRIRGLLSREWYKLQPKVEAGSRRAKLGQLAISGAIVLTGAGGYYFAAKTSGLHEVANVLGAGHDIPAMPLGTGHATHLDTSNIDVAAYTPNADVASADVLDMPVTHATSSAHNGISLNAASAHSQPTTEHYIAMDQAAHPVHRADSSSVVASSQAGWHDHESKQTLGHFVDAGMPDATGNPGTIWNTTLVEAQRLGYDPANMTSADQTKLVQSVLDRNGWTWEHASGLSDSEQVKMPDDTSLANQLSKMTGKDGKPLQPAAGTLAYAHFHPQPAAPSPAPAPSSRHNEPTVPEAPAKAPTPPPEPPAHSSQDIKPLPTAAPSHTAAPLGSAWPYFKFNHPTSQSTPTPNAHPSGFLAIIGAHPTPSAAPSHVASTHPSASESNNTTHGSGEDESMWDYLGGIPVLLPVAGVLAVGVAGYGDYKIRNRQSRLPLYEAYDGEYGNYEQPQLAEPTTEEDGTAQARAAIDAARATAAATSSESTDEDTDDEDGNRGRKASRFYSDVKTIPARKGGSLNPGNRSALSGSTIWRTPVAPASEKPVVKKSEPSDSVADDSKPAAKRSDPGN